jgi:single-strand DNA-binding protein
MINTVAISGNLSADPILKYSPDGMAICEFSVAVNDRHKKGETWVDEVSFIGVVAFGKKAENCAEYLEKGSKVSIQGKLKQNSYEDKDGKKISKTKVIIQIFEAHNQKKNPSNVSPSEAKPVQNADEDIPF